MPAQITLGADPEFFILDERIMEVIPAMEVGGTKEAPIPMDGMADGFNYHRDNVMIEFGIPPQKNPRDLAMAIGAGIDYINNNVCRNLPETEGYGAVYYNADLYHFDDEDLDDPRAQEFGCEPDQDAYEGGQQRVTADNLMGNHRTAGGHVHIGSDVGFNCPNFIVALLCDAYVGYREPTIRKNQGQGYLWYRKPGIYRDKPYGIEYRTLSNYWTFSGTRIMNVGQRAQTVGRFCAEADAKEIRKAIECVDWLHVRAKMLGGCAEDEQKMLKVWKMIGQYE